MTESLSEEVWTIIGATGCPIAGAFVTIILAMVLYVIWRFVGPKGIVWIWWAERNNL